MLGCPQRYHCTARQLLETLAPHIVERGRKEERVTFGKRRKLFKTIELAMPPKGGKRAKGEGNTSDRSENISGDDGAGQVADDPPKRRDLTPTMPAFAQGERNPPAVSENFGAAFTTPGAARAEGNIPPDFRLDNVLSLPEQLALPMREQRFEDAKRLKATMISSIVMYNLGVGPRFAYVSASARPQNNKLLWGPSKLADI